MEAMETQAARLGRQTFHQAGNFKLKTATVVHIYISQQSDNIYDLAVLPS